MGEWISVKDRLPENDEDVLVYNYRDGIHIGNYEARNVSGYYEEDASYTYTDTGWNVEYSWSPHMSTTHWMPLPLPPEE